MYDDFWGMECYGHGKNPFPVKTVKNLGCIYSTPPETNVT